MKATAILAAVSMGVLCCGCDILAPPEPDYSRADRQIEALMDEIEKLRESEGTKKVPDQLQEQLELAERETAGVEGGGADCDEAAYQALIRELNECAARLEKCTGPPAKAESTSKTKPIKPPKPATVPADLENPFE